MDIFKKYGAKAIWPDGEKKLNRYVRFQTEFYLESSKEVQFFICADTKYELYINGNLAGFGQYEDFPDEKVYDAYDISKFVKDGNNLVSILAYSQGENSFHHLTGLPMVIFLAKSLDGIVLRSDENVLCADAQEFLQGKTEPLTYQRSFNFGFDLRGDDGWRENKVSSIYQSAFVCDDSKITYIPRPIKNLVLGKDICGKVINQGVFAVSDGETVSEKMQYSFLAYREEEKVIEKDGNCILPKCENVFWILDLGKETAGYITLEIEAEDGAVLDIAIGEHLADLRVRSYVGGRNFAFRCVCREGRQKIRFLVKRLAGRYLQIFSHKGIKKAVAGLTEVNYPLGFTGDFNIGDRLFKRIYDVSKDTLTLCMHEHYEDCPQREQALYAMDSRNQMLTGYFAFGETEMPRSSLALFAKGQLDSGLLPICAPAYYSQTIPSFTLAWILALREYVLFSGDLDFAKEMKSVAEKILGFFVALKKDGIIMRPQTDDCWNFYEWIDGMENLENDPKIKADAPLNSFCIMALKAYEEICHWLGDEDSKWAKAEYEEIINAYHKTFYNEEKKVYHSYIGEDIEPSFAQLTQALALLSGAVPKPLEKDIRKSLLSDALAPTTLSYLIFKYDALMQEADTYSDFVLSDIESQWGYMLYQGATSFWETLVGEADFFRAGSLCHGWSAVPIYIFWRYILGIYPENIGFGKIKPNPVCAPDMKIDATLKTPNGIFEVKKEKGKIKIKKI